jgi:hypothetical protein
MAEENYPSGVRSNDGVAEEDVSTDDDPEVPPLENGPGPFRMMLEMVAVKKGMNGNEAAVWVDAVRIKLALVGFISVRDFVEGQLSINRKLHAAGMKQMHYVTLELMAREIAEMLWGVPNAGLLDV